MAKIKLHSVDSSNINSMGYDPDEKIMRIKFHNGSTYEYPEVDIKLYKAIKNAPSVGKALNAFKRTKPKYYKV